jgi:6-phosphogluconate dehydrogenase
LWRFRGKVAGIKDAATGKPLLDVIVDAAGQKGAGRWTVIEAQHLAAPIPAVEAAVTARNLSSRRAERTLGERLFGTAVAPSSVTLDLNMLEHALIARKIMCYAQGFTMIDAASREFG